MSRKKAKPSSVSHQEVRALLKSRGLRATPGRLATYAHLRNSARPLTHRQIADALTDTGVDPATVFRNLQDLTEAGLVARADLGDHVWRFELEGQHEGHPHFVCTECGDVSCLDQVDIQVSGGKVPRALKKQAVDVSVRGQCDDCGP